MTRDQLVNLLHRLPEDWDVEIRFGHVFMTPDAAHFDEERGAAVIDVEITDVCPFSVTEVLAAYQMWAAGAERET
jgi:hypothetical protein